MRENLVSCENFNMKLEEIIWEKYDKVCKFLVFFCRYRLQFSVKIENCSFCLSEQAVINSSIEKILQNYGSTCSLQVPFPIQECNMGKCNMRVAGQTQANAASPAENQPTAAPSGGHRQLAWVWELGQIVLWTDAKIGHQQRAVRNSHDMEEVILV